ncbi:aminodeoxychorismate synthase component I [Weeksellaceae bacterium KMM 9724]|uniref:aminodeoxychorismate synthase component I n=1 Tax=Profundicola chukchiensis TaxID=2961959 RepID=UPI00243A93E5|nr:aminodeoxychorismate synthase component I [Profundicola chukchiensis]MDG4951114.1 aminodeoxychorismate synthase component I [Profundicola chukchiensis]
MADWVEQLNSYGKQKIPCGFFIDFLGENSEIFPLENLKENNIWLDFPQFKNSASKTTHKEIQLEADYPKLAEYKPAFDLVQYHLQRGDSYLINLTFATPISLNLDLEEIYQQIQAKYKIKFKKDWLCFSPETFVQIQQNRIATFPMKGTIDASIPNAAEQLLNNIKEKAEHHTIVDLLRNDLSKVAKKVKVDKFMYLDELQTQKGNILQMSSEISGELVANWQNHLGSIMKELLPAGSISGAPKNKTLEIISEAENYDRNYYTGIAGVFDGENLDSCVLIRFIENTKNGMLYKSGGGITAMSKLEDEYAELKQKIYVPIH